MVNVQQTFNLSPRASHLLERLCSNQNVLSSLQHLMAGSICWLLTAVNVYLHSGSNAFSSFACSDHFLSPLSPARSAVPVLACSASSRAEGHSPRSRFLPETWVSRQGGWRHCRDGPRRDVPLQWRSLCSPRRQQGFLHHLYTRWQHIMLLCSWSGFKDTNADNMQPSAEFSQYRSDLLPFPLFSFKSN